MYPEEDESFKFSGWMNFMSILTLVICVDNMYIPTLCPSLKGISLVERQNNLHCSHILQFARTHACSPPQYLALSSFQHIFESLGISSNEENSLTNAQMIDFSVQLSEQRFFYVHILPSANRLSGGYRPEGCTGCGLGSTQRCVPPGGACYGSVFCPASGFQRFSHRMSRRKYFLVGQSHHSDFKQVYVLVGQIELTKLKQSLPNGMPKLKLTLLRGGWTRSGLI